MKLCKLHVFLAALVLALGLGETVARAADFTVLVEPVEVFNSAEAKELAPGIRSMVASRVSGQGYAVTTDQAAKATALFTLRTTVTRLGGMFSVDAELSSSAAGVDGARAYETVPDVDSLMKGVDKVAERVRYRLWQVSVSRGAAPGEANTQAPLDRHPPPAYQPLPPYASRPAETKAAAQEAAAIGDALGVYREEVKIDGEVLSLASADIDGDGHVEIIAIFDRETSIYRETARGLEPIWSGKLDLGFKPLCVSAADVDRDRTVEIFIAGASGADPLSQVYIWRNGALVEKGDRVNGFLRVYDNPERGAEVLGMVSAGGVEVFRDGLRVYTWTGSEWEAGAKIPLPNYVNTPNVQWLRFGQSATSLFVLDREHKLRIYNDSGEKLYVTEKPMQGTRARIEGEPRDTRNMEPGDIWEIDPPAVVWDAPDGQRYAVLHSNIEPTLVSNRWGLFDNGSLVAVRWDGLALHTGGESPKFQGFFSATARGAVDASGRGKLYSALVKVDGTIFRSYKTTILSFNL